MAAAKAVAVLRGNSTVSIIPPSLPVPALQSSTVPPSLSSATSSSSTTDESQPQQQDTTAMTTSLSSSSSSSSLPTGFAAPVLPSSTFSAYSSTGIYGIIRFQQSINQIETVTTRINGKITGLQPNRKYGIRIVIYGDESDTNFRAMGGIYNPYSRPHSDRLDDDRAIGALGNIETNMEGIAFFDFGDPLVKLIGPLSVIGRSIVITQNEDDGGKGTHPDSLIDGNSGPIIAAGVIGISAIPIM